MNILIKSVVASVIVHAMIAAYPLSANIDKPVKQNPLTPVQYIQAEVIIPDKVKNIRSTLADKKNNYGTDTGHLRKQPHGVPEFDKECAKNNNFTGIGALVSLEDNVIFSVPPGYPAYDAGLKINDLIVSVSPSADDYGYKEIVIMRKDVTLQFRIRPARICYEPNSAALFSDSVKD